MQVQSRYLHICPRHAPVAHGLGVNVSFYIGERDIDVWGAKDVESLYLQDQELQVGRGGG